MENNMAGATPFIRAPGTAGAAFFDRHYADEIIANFESDLSSRYVYKIIGLRKSGKSAELRKVIHTLSKRQDWLVYLLSPADDLIAALIAKLRQEPLASRKWSSASASAEAESGTSENMPLSYSSETELSQMIQAANDNGFKVLVGIDDIAASPEAVRFLSLWNAMMLESEKQLYFVCAGLPENIEALADAPNLGFFRRSDTIEIGR